MTPFTGRFAACRRFAFYALIAAATGCTAEPQTDDGPVDLRVRLAVPEGGYQVKSAPHTVAPGEESQKCDVVRIEPKNGERMVWLNGFESLASEHTHHMNVLIGQFSYGDFLFGEGKAEAMLGRKLGQYDCAELGDLMASQGAQTIYPSQRASQGATFPPGIGLPLPLPLVVIMDHHFINTTDTPVVVNAAFNLHQTDAGSIKHGVTLFWGEKQVEVPPKSRKLVAHTCALPRDVNLMAVSSHTHAKAKCFTANLYDGAAKTIEPKPFFVNNDWESPPILFMDQAAWTGNKPVPMKAGDGFHFSCLYENHEDNVLKTGPKASDEMCIFVSLGYPATTPVEKVKEVFAHPTLDALVKLQSAMNEQCVPVTDATSPWPHADEAVALAPALRPAHAIDENACDAYDTTGAE